MGLAFAGATILLFAYTAEAGCGTRCDLENTCVFSDACVSNAQLSNGNQDILLSGDSCFVDDSGFAHMSIIYGPCYAPQPGLYGTAHLFRDGNWVQNLSWPDAQSLSGLPPGDYTISVTTEYWYCPDNCWWEPGGSDSFSWTVAEPVAIVNGQCSSPAVHYNCNVGTSANNVSGATSWTWNCNGSGGGTNASCSEPKPPPRPNIWADPTVVNYGGTSRIKWELNGNSNCSIGGTNGDSIGNNPLTGNNTITGITTRQLYIETKYVITCTGTGASDSVTIQVRPKLEEI